MSFFSLMFPTVREEDFERPKKSPEAAPAAQAAPAEGQVAPEVVAVITAALHAHGDAANDRLADRVGKFDPWSMKFFGLRNDLALRNPWLQGNKNYGAWAKRR